jgi:hypothetical protein
MRGPCFSTARSYKSADIGVLLVGSEEEHRDQELATVSSGHHTRCDKPCREAHLSLSARRRWRARANDIPDLPDDFQDQ